MKLLFAIMEAGHEIYPTWRVYNMNISWKAGIYEVIKRLAWTCPACGRGNCPVLWSKIFAKNSHLDPSSTWKPKINQFVNDKFLLVIKSERITIWNAKCLLPIWQDKGKVFFRELVQCQPFCWYRSSMLWHLVAMWM